MMRAVSPVDTKVEAKMDAGDTPPSPAQKAEHKTRGRPFERPSALRRSIQMPRKLRNNSVDIARITSGLLGSTVARCGIPS